MATSLGFGFSVFRWVRISAYRDQEVGFTGIRVRFYGDGAYGFRLIGEDYGELIIGEFMGPPDSQVGTSSES